MRRTDCNCKLHQTQATRHLGNSGIGSHFRIGILDDAIAMGVFELFVSIAADAIEFQ